MPTIKSFLQECLLTERKLFQIIMILTAISLISLLVTSVLVFLDDQLSIWGLWYLALFHIVGISFVVFLSIMLACLTRWTRDGATNQGG